MNDDPYGDRRELYVSTAAGIWLPMVQAVISGFITGVLVLSLAMLEHWQSPGLVGLAAGGVVAALVWFISLAGWRRVVYGFERAFGQDIDGDHQVGEPVRIELKQGNSLRLFDLPIDDDRLIEIFEGLVDGQSFSESAWTGASGVLTRSEFSALRGELIKRGLAMWNSPRSTARGASLTLAGRNVLREYAAKSRAPYPTLEKRGPKNA